MPFAAATGFTVAAIGITSLSMLGYVIRKSCPKRKLICRLSLDGLSLRLIIKTLF